jgi:hypothetical protein
MALLVAGATLLPMAIAYADASAPHDVASDTSTDDAREKGFRLQLTVK